MNVSLLSLVFTLFLSLAFSNCVSASESNLKETGPKKVEWIKAQGNGIHMKLEQFSDSTICSSSNFFLNMNSDANYDAKVSALLSAYVRTAEINIRYSDCSTGHIAVGDVELVN